MAVIRAARRAAAQRGSSGSVGSAHRRLVRVDLLTELGGSARASPRA
jgi:hypothetical protein